MSNQEPVNKWIYGPAARAFQLVVDEIVLAGLTERATFSLVQLPTLLGFIRSESKHSVLKAHKQLEKLHEISLGDAEFAKKEVETGFSRLHIHSLMSLWSFVEACLEDTAIALIKNCNQSDIDSSAIFFGRAADLPLFDDQSAQRAKRRFLNAIKDEFKANYINTFEIFFRDFDIKLNNNRDRLDKMQEVNSLRNCVLHRSRIVDEYAVCLSPGLPFKVGDEIMINSGQFGEYMTTISDYILNFHNTVLACKHMTVVSR